MSADVAAAPLTAARKKKNRIAVISVIALVAVLAAVGAVFLLKPKTSATSTASTAAVQRKTLKILVSGTGNTVVSNSVTVNPQISGTVEKLYVSLGETVTAGQELYTISDSNVQTQLLQAKAQLLQSKQSKNQAQQSLAQAQNQLYSAKTQQIQSQQALDKLESQPATAPDVANQIVIAKRQVASAKKAVSVAQSGINGAQIGVSVAKANLTSAQKSYDDAQTSTNDTVVTAPIDGVITALPISVGSAVSAGTSSSSGSSSSSSKTSGSSGSSAAASTGSSSAGSSSGSSSGSLTISNVSDLNVQVSVSEVDVPSLTIGQKATVTFDAITDRTFTGTVSSISPNGTSSSGVVNYDVVLTLDSQDPRLKPDMTATADIETKVAENVLVVPNAAVKTDGTTKYVVVSGNGGTQNVKVTTGVADETYTEIKSGITEGATVVTGSTTASTSSSSSSSSTKSTRSGGFMMGGGPGGPGGN